MADIKLGDMIEYGFYGIKEPGGPKISGMLVKVDKRPDDVYDIMLLTSKGFEWASYWSDQDTIRKIC